MTTPSPGNPYPGPPGNPYAPPPPPAGPPAGKQRLRGRTPLRLALIFGVIGIALTVAGGVVLANSPLGKVDSFPRVSFAAGSRTVQLNRTGNYVGYFESPSNASHHAFVQMRITNSGGTPVPLSEYSDHSNLTYDQNGKHGEAVFTFTIAQPGDYTVQVQSSDAAPGSDMALGESIAHGLVIGVGLILPGILLIITAVVLLIVGLVRRSRHKRQLSEGGGYGPYGGYGGYPPGPPGPTFTAQQPPGQAPQGYQPPQGPGGQGYQQGGYPPPGQAAPPR
jgi:hypothetical protein